MDLHPQFFDEVVCVTDELVTALLKLFVQCVEQGGFSIRRRTQRVRGGPQGRPFFIHGNGLDGAQMALLAFSLNSSILSGVKP